MRTCFLSVKTNDYVCFRAIPVREIKYAFVTEIENYFK